MVKQQLTTIGRVEEVDFPEIGIFSVPARIDTGAQTSAIWATSVRENAGMLEFVLFDESSEFYTGEKLRVEKYDVRKVASSNGIVERRFAVKMLVELQSRKVRANFTLADRSKQVYPVLLGRNFLLGKFLVNVKLGKPGLEAEQKKSRFLRKSSSDKGAKS
ncbi:MAG TPA: RimK/LysX family protein [Candidatus Saccharimonadales bacterium]|nr:RimK/LysX family protein [Candidatus Saccharimonadales bacterium]